MATFKVKEGKTQGEILEKEKEWFKLYNIQMKLKF